ncbi:hypothetical protein PSI19_18680 [Xenorhabdus khoisanae]|uniref:hypothetical protein n=1 Tax=Xenorhabdus khoisanae TaxID=880157 RepID=UPI0023599269|nr:hypothetical protein [Xenorhabdus khoisanae]MDC9615857.1 hypothetical protein [Xenorhabdus khoisanae]
MNQQHKDRRSEYWKSLGYTDEQIAEHRELEHQGEVLGRPGIEVSDMDFRGDFT